MNTTKCNLDIYIFHLNPLPEGLKRTKIYVVQTTDCTDACHPVYIYLGPVSFFTPSHLGNSPCYHGPFVHAGRFSDSLLVINMEPLFLFLHWKSWLDSTHHVILLYSISQLIVHFLSHEANLFLSSLISVHTDQEMHKHEI